MTASGTLEPGCRVTTALRRRVGLDGTALSHPDAQSGKIAGIMQQQGQTHPALGAANYHSGIEREIQIDHVGIQADRSIRESELAYADRMSRDTLLEPTEDLREVLHDP